jgi:hypothetical protein
MVYPALLNVLIPCACGLCKSVDLLENALIKKIKIIQQPLYVEYNNEQVGPETVYEKYFETWSHAIQYGAQAHDHGILCGRISPRRS